MKTRPLGVEMFHAEERTVRGTDGERRTDVMKVIVSSRIFA